MANTNLFASAPRGKLAPKATTTNRAGGRAYALGPEHALAQLAATGCLTATYYAGAADQLADVLAAAKECSSRFVAQAAIYARVHGHMKDMPALLLAELASRKTAESAELLRLAFPRVVNNGRMVRTFVQIMRSGATGRKSMGSGPRNLVRQYIQRRTHDQLFADSVGTTPSLSDVIKMVHPKPRDPAEAALYGYLTGAKPAMDATDGPADIAGPYRGQSPVPRLRTARTYRADDLPLLVQWFEGYKADRSRPVPPVPFQMLTALDLGEAEWTEIARRANWHTTRMNLNTFARHGVFKREGMAALIAARLRDPDQVAESRVFPYQLLMAYLATGDGGGGVPFEVREALQDAMEVATLNTPTIPGNVVICPDVSGSMNQGSVTGDRGSASSRVRPIDVAALFSACLLRSNKSARVMPFDTRVVPVQVNPRDSVMTNAKALGAIGGGGTNCAAPIAALNAERAHVDVAIIVSDNESWCGGSRGHGPITPLLDAWFSLLRRCPRAKLVCIDVQATPSSQAPNIPGVLNVGGFSDSVFDVVAQFVTAEGENGSAWVDKIRAVAL